VTREVREPASGLVRKSVRSIDPIAGPVLLPAIIGLDARATLFNIEQVMH
jgi:hypothetical protein